MEDTYLTISKAKIGQGIYSEKRSKFLAFAHHVDTEDEAKKIVKDYKKEYFDARHVCYAYSIGIGEPIIRMNDDGEPSSTGGRPIYGQIQKSRLNNIIIIVVRYYGGVNLGTGPLAVAYKTAAAEAIEDASIVECIRESIVEYSFPYIKTNDVMRIVKDMDLRIVSQTFDNTCHIVLAVRQSKSVILQERLSKI